MDIKELKQQDFKITNSELKHIIDLYVDRTFSEEVDFLEEKGG